MRVRVLHGGGFLVEKSSRPSPSNRLQLLYWLARPEAVCEVTTNGLGPLVTSALRTGRARRPWAAVTVAVAALARRLVAIAVIVFDPATSGKAFSTTYRWRHSDPAVDYDPVLGGPSSAAHVGSIGAETGPVGGSRIAMLTAPGAGWACGSRWVSACA